MFAITNNDSGRTPPAATMFFKFYSASDARPEKSGMVCVFYRDILPHIYLTTIDYSKKWDRFNVRDTDLDTVNRFNERDLYWAYAPTVEGE